MSSNPFSLRPLLIVAAATLAVVLLTLAVGYAVIPRNAPTSPALAEGPFGRSVSVSGTAVVKVIPDRAEISMSVITKDRDPVAAQKKNTAAAKAVLASTKTRGMTSSAMSPGGFDLSESEEYDRKAERYFTVYTVTTDVVLTVKDLSKVGEVLGAAVEAGANKGRVEFKSDKLRENRDKARVLAITAAKEKAKLMADATGVKIDKVLSFNEGSDYRPWGGGSATNQTQNVVQVQNAPIEVPAGMDEQFGGGTIDISMTMNVDFELKPMKFAMN